MGQATIHVTLHQNVSFSSQSLFVLCFREGVGEKGTRGNSLAIVCLSDLHKWLHWKDVHSSSHTQKGSKCLFWARPRDIFLPNLERRTGVLITVVNQNLQVLKNLESWPWGGNDNRKNKFEGILKQEYLGLCFQV